MHESNLKLAKYEPLTFQCIHCEQQFAVIGDSFEKLGADVSEHLKKSHPERLRSQPQARAA